MPSPASWPQDEQFPLCCSCDHLTGCARARETRHNGNLGLSGPWARWICAMGGIFTHPTWSTRMQESFQCTLTLVCQEVTQNLTMELPYFRGAFLGTLGVCLGVGLAVCPSLSCHKRRDAPARCQLAKCWGWRRQCHWETNSQGREPSFWLFSFGR